MLHRKHILGYANQPRRKFLLRRSFVKRIMLRSLSIRCVRTSSGRQKQHLGVNASRISLHTCSTFRNKIVAKPINCYKLTLRRNSAIDLYKHEITAFTKDTVSCICCNTFLSFKLLDKENII